MTTDETLKAEFLRSWNVSSAAKSAGVSDTTAYLRLRRLGLPVPERAPPLTGDAAREAIEEHGSVAEAARQLGCARSTLHRAIQAGAKPALSGRAARQAVEECGGLSAAAKALGVSRQTVWRALSK